MNKNLYFKLDNGDTPYILDSVDSCADIIKAESSDVQPDNKLQPEWTITPVWLTQEEFENLPED